MAGCNRFMGRYELSKEKGFVMDPGGMTMMACPDLEFEDIYMKALSGSHFASMENERLIIEGNDGKTVLIYEPYVKEVGVAMDMPVKNSRNYSLQTARIRKLQIM